MLISSHTLTHMETHMRSPCCLSSSLACWPCMASPHPPYANCWKRAVICKWFNLLIEKRWGWLQLSPCGCEAREEKQGLELWFRQRLIVPSNYLCGSCTEVICRFLHVCMSICVCLCLNVHLLLDSYLRINLGACKCVCVCVCVCMCVCVCVWFSKQAAAKA